MLGLILCGGQSRRMGNDKGLLKQNGQCWVQIAAHKLSALHIPVKVSVNGQQLVSYAGIFSTADLIADDKTLSVNGPLLGLLSCHMAFPAQDIFVLACDMLLMETPQLYPLLEKHRQENFDAYIFTNNGEAEPLCGIYTANALLNTLKLYQKEKLHKHSMKSVLERLKVCTIALREEEKKYFQNFNTPGEMDTTV
jgi:molybdenum cofactor guanylyltransferase